MVIKTDTCFFSEHRIYPGHGITFIRRDMRKLAFIDKKNKHLYLTDRKPLNLRWNKAWRRANKKETVLRQVKKEKRKAVKSERGIEGLSLQDLLRKKNETTAIREQNRQQRAKDIKERKEKDVSYQSQLSVKQRLKALKAKKDEKGGDKKTGQKQAKGKAAQSKDKKAAPQSKSEKPKATTGGSKSQPKKK